MNREQWADAVARSVLGSLPACLPGSPLHYAIIDAVLRHCDPRGDGWGWQPIETAPRNGVSILCYTAEFGGNMGIRWHQSYGWTGGFAEEDPWTPTHWMPLPEPPP